MPKTTQKKGKSKGYPVDPTAKLTIGAMVNIMEQTNPVDDWDHDAAKDSQGEPLTPYIFYLVLYGCIKEIESYDPDMARHIRRIIEDQSSAADGDKFVTFMVDEENKPKPWKEIYEFLKELQKHTKIRLPEYGNLTNLGIFNTLDRIITHSGDLKSDSRKHEKYQILRNPNQSYSWIHETRTEKQEITIKDPEALFGQKTKGSFIRLFYYTMQHMTAQNYPKTLIIDLEEMVELGMYADVEGAYKALKRFTIENGNIYFDYTLKGAKKANRLGFLFYNIDRNENKAKISVNEKLNVEALAGQFTNFPSWGYQLNGKSFMLLRYIFYIARQNCEEIKEKKSFNLGLDSVREYLGLPKPCDVRNWKYKQNIIDPIEKAIEDIEGVKERGDGLMIDIVIDETSKDIDVWLSGYLRIYLSESYAEPFATRYDNFASKRLKTEKQRERRKLALLKEKVAIPEKTPEA